MLKLIYLIEDWNHKCGQKKNINVFHKMKFYMKHQPNFFYETFNYNNYCSNNSLK